MFKLPFTIILFICVTVSAQNPHGEGLKINCSNCHDPNTWKEILPVMNFNHSVESGFDLAGQHSQLQCIDCHENLIFNSASENCITCHVDVHETTVGSDCERCHNTQSWLINNIYEIHQYTRFPLVGPHQVPNCSRCHTGASDLSFPPISVDCFDCHQRDYQSETWHLTSSISTNCTECHTSNLWEQSHFDHNVTSFLLTPSHLPLPCSSCHLDDTNYKDYSCIDCHTHNRQTTDEQHANHHYTYESTACRMCHPVHEIHHGKFN